MGSSTKCPKCGNWYDSSTYHVCSKGENLEKAYFGSRETVESGDGSNKPSP